MSERKETHALTFLRVPPWTWVKIMIVAEVAAIACVLIGGPLTLGAIVGTTAAVMGTTMGVIYILQPPEEIL